MSEIKFEKGGRLTLPVATSKELGDRAMQLSSYSQHHLLLDATEAEESVQLVGAIGEICIVDMLSFFNMFRKSGLVHFTLAGGDKTLYFQNGEIVFATSSFPEEDIGEVLYSLGKFDREILQGARQFANGELPLGKILIDQNIITSQDLWTATRNQVEVIVYNLFAFQEGSFVFVNSQLDESQIVSLSMNTQNLIMEGLRRFDERAVFMQKVKSLDAIPVASGEVPNDLDSISQKMVVLIQAGVNDVKELLRRSGSGEFDALRLLSHLVERGVVSMEEAPTVAVEGVLGEVISIFNGVLVAMCRVVSEKNPQFREEVSCFLRDLPQPFSYVFRQTNLKEDGSVDGGRILANLAGLEEGDKLRLLSESLSELVYMECISARRELGAADSAELIKRVQEVSNRVNDLIGN
ncbi:MAG: DUF4388 domain-containing protein [Desulfuromonadales bacterium]|nr:DUF4388 domain-containing protein [Desulfuromonadales bacterium]